MKEKGKAKEVKLGESIKKTKTVFFKKGCVFVTVLALTLFFFPGFAGNGLFKSYVPLIHGGTMPVKTEITMKTNPIQGYPYDYGRVYIEAYAPDGTLLETKTNLGVFIGFYKTFSVEDLFPNLNPDNIGWLEVGADNLVDVWIKYYGAGTSIACVKAPSVLKSQIPLIHLIPDNDYWQSFLSAVKTTEDGNLVKLNFYPSNFETTLDGTLNQYNWQTPDLSNNKGSINIEVKTLFSNGETEGMEWATMESRYIDASNPAITIDNPTYNLIAVAPFFKTNGTCGGAFETEQIPSARFIIPHIATNKAADGTPLWWNGYVIVNPSNNEVNGILIPYSADGKRLDADPEAEGTNGIKLTVPPHGKLIGLMRDLNLPEGTDYIEAYFDGEVYRGFLFGGEPGTSIEKVMAGTDLPPSGLVGGLIDVTDQDRVPVYEYFLPLAQSHPTETENGAWTGLVIVNQGIEKEVKLSYVNQDDIEIGSQFLNLKHNEKFVGTLEDLLKEADLEDIREEVRGIYIESNPRNMFNGNTPLYIVELVGGISKDDNSHVGMIGVSPVLVNNSAPEVYLTIENQSMGLEDTINNLTHLVFEDNDLISYNITVKLNCQYLRIDHVSIKVVDKDGNMVGGIGGGSYIDLPQDANFYNGYLLNLSGVKLVDSDVGPYSEDENGNPIFDYHLAVKLTVNGQTYTYNFNPNPVSGLLPTDTPQIAIVPEKCLIVVNAYEILQDDEARRELAELLGSDEVTYGINGSETSFEQEYQNLIDLTDSSLSNYEILKENGCEINQIGNKFYYLLEDNNGSFYVTYNLLNEAIEYKIKKFFEDHGAQFTVDDN